MESAVVIIGGASSSLIFLSIGVSSQEGASVSWLVQDFECVSSSPLITSCYLSNKK